MSQQVQIAQTIASQIGGRRLMALGGFKKTALPRKEGQLGGLAFKASLFGAKQCLVSVVLTPADLYNLTVTSPRSGRVIAKLDGLYCDQLGTELELAVEKHFAS